MIEFNNTKIFTDNIDYAALNQLHELEKTEVFGNQPIRIMPDVHAGAGCVIGFTAPIDDKIIPNLVGVDIGCGMLCCALGKVEIDYAALDKVIRDNVPSGRNVGKFNPAAHESVMKLRCKDKLDNIEWLECSLGTLGGGNHFIEVDEDSEGGKYLVIHTGSRNLGKQVAEHYQSVAISECRRSDANEVIKTMRAQGRDREIEGVLREMKSAPKLAKELCYLSGKSMEDYLHDLKICVEFADCNRELIAAAILRGYFRTRYSRADDSFTTRHNYIDENRMVRKGAIAAHKGDKVLIPLNMRDGCIIGIGKGNPDWNESAPHGAGRSMSRAQAKAQIDVRDFKDTMKGVYSSTVSEATVDESPFAYKPSEEIISLVSETVDIVKIIKPVYNYKAAE